MTRPKNTKAKDCSPTPEDFNKLIQVADDSVKRFILASAGIYGFDKAMITHFKPSWVQLHKNEIVIPSSQPCDIGEDGKPCYWCKTHNQGVWHPKGRTTNKGFTTCRNTEPRDFGWHPWGAEVIRVFIANYSKFPYSDRSINRILDEMCEKAKTSRHITVHGLRSFAASNYAAKGLDQRELGAQMGWSPNSNISAEYIQLYKKKEKLYKEGGLI